MTQISTANYRVIHAGWIHPYKQKARLVLLREISPHHFVWFEEVERADVGAGLGAESESTRMEIETSVFGHTIQDALREAHQEWKHQNFRTIICGFKYTLPERDEHGINALFYEMVAAHKTLNGTYFDSALGHQCQIQRASREAIDLMHRLEKR